jgi:hypothetical protein
MEKSNIDFNIQCEYVVDCPFKLLIDSDVDKVLQCLVFWRSERRTPKSIDAENQLIWLFLANFYFKIHVIYTAPAQRK